MCDWLIDRSIGRLTLNHCLE